MSERKASGEGTCGACGAGKDGGCGNSSGTCGGKSKAWIWLLLIVAVGLVLVAKNRGTCVPGGTCAVEPPTASAPAAMPAAAGNTNTATADVVAPVPRLVDLGAGKCIPCKMMAPILEDLKKTYAGKMDVNFIDVWENPDAGKEYGINMIPTQIFYDAAGKELFRHEGFFSKEDILAKWKELGVALPEVVAVQEHK